MRWHYRSLFVLIAIVGVAAVFLSDFLLQAPLKATEALLQPAPTQPLGYYDYFGKLLNPQQAEQLVRQKGLDPKSPGAYERVGAVKITQQLIDSGENIFFNRKIGDTLGLQRVFGFSVGFAQILPEVTEAILKLHGKPTTNLRITLKKDLTLGSRTYRRGSTIDTGLNVEKGSFFPQGLQLDGNLSCATCHADLSASGKRLKGVPNGEEHYK
ncbi:hypothetical protein [Chroogloeocystis siderophila]|uniref:Cytochrome c domain-containing protein n=1 Tax=Chroogloeocystis siderophila 5.2 s.c.1 TaxID=247279 RepID=A0A1U7HG20_9CHRO|nr:hypothetical protein [Chroogloeocystis siderophila]OKH22491.1 hypothetical protein NIES1031_20280 [Chroogloeocystis siderophila 5.2 s.c.1]